MKVAAVLAVSVAVLSGCSASGGAAADPVADGELTASQQACMDAVAPDVEAASGDLELVLPDAPLDLEALRGKTVWVVGVAINQFASDMLSGFEAAAEVAGVEVVSYDGQGMVNRFNEGIQQAIAAEADAIVLTSIDAPLVAQSLEDAAAAGIPVLNSLNGDPGDPIPGGTYGNQPLTLAQDAELQAKWALFDSGCSANMLAVWSSAAGGWIKMHDAAKAVFEEYCPDDCTFTDVNIDLANAATDIQSKVSTALQRDPGIDYVYAMWGSAVDFVAPAISSADVTFMTHDGLSTNIERLASGELDVDQSFPPVPWIGWVVFDNVARELTGAEPAGLVVGSHTITSENVGDGSLDTMFPNYVDFETAFQDAWNG